MSTDIQGVLTPVGGGDEVPLIRPLLTVGRRESCDVCMRFPNISGLHCEMSFREGYWFIRDLNSTNGVHVNGTRVRQKVLFPGDEVTIGKRKYTITYTLPLDMRPPEEDTDVANVMGQSLLEKAGLERPRHATHEEHHPLSSAELMRRLGREPDPE